MEKLYRFADQDFLIKSVFDYFSKFAKDYAIEKSNNYQIVEVSLEEVKNWADAHNDGEYPLEYLETLVIHSKISEILVGKGVFIFHGSTIYCDSLNNCYIFTAPSGTGKSTHINILKRVYGDRVNYINDDKPFIASKDGKYYVYGSPWNGKARLDNNVKGLLKGIFIVKRASDNSVKPLPAKEAVMSLIQQIHIPNGFDNTQKGSDFLFALVNDIPCYTLAINTEVEAAITSMKIMEKENNLCERKKD